MNALVAVIAVIVILGLIVLARGSIKIVQEYERGVIFRLGRSQGAKGPGVFFIIPVVDRIVRTNLQIIAVPVTSQAVITKDNVTATVDAVAFFQVVDAAASVIQVHDWYSRRSSSPRPRCGRSSAATSSTSCCRSGTASTPSSRSRSTPRRRRGAIKVHRVEIRDVGVPVQMQRAMARQAEAERTAGRGHRRRRAAGGCRAVSRASAPSPTTVAHQPRSTSSSSRPAAERRRIAGTRRPPMGPTSSSVGQRAPSPAQIGPAAKRRAMSRAAISGLSNFSSRRWAREHRARCSVRTNRLRLTAAARDAGSNAPAWLGEPRAEARRSSRTARRRRSSPGRSRRRRRARGGPPRRRRTPGPPARVSSVLQRVEHPPVVGLVGQRVADEELEQVGGVGGGVDPARARARSRGGRSRRAGSRWPASSSAVDLAGVEEVVLDVAVGEDRQGQRRVRAAHARPASSAASPSSPRRRSGTSRSTA